MLILLAALAAATTPSDGMHARLERCLASEGGSSTGGETLCYETARKSYQASIAAALSGLRRSLGPAARRTLDAEQQAWVAYVDAHRSTMAAILSTKTGSMVAPMQEADDMNMVRDRAVRLEAQLRILEIEP